MAVGWGRFPAASRQRDLPAGGPGLLPGRVIVQIPPCRCSLPPLPASHKKGLSLASPLPAHGAPQAQEGDRRQVAGTGQAARGGPGEADGQRGYGLVLQHK